MANGQTIILRGRSQRAHAKWLIDKAPVDAVVNIREGKRTTAQNDRMWAMLSDISRAKPQGRVHPPEMWKALFMHSLGHPVQFETGLNDQPFPVGFRSSRLTVAQMSDLMEFMSAYGAEHGVVWSEPAAPA